MFALDFFQRCGTTMYIIEWTVSYTVFVLQPIMTKQLFFAPSIGVNFDHTNDSQLVIILSYSTPFLEERGIFDALPA